MYDAVRDYPSVARVVWFTQGLFKMSERDGKVIISDLRMGQEPYYSFNFIVGQRQSPTIAAVRPIAFARTARRAERGGVAVAADVGRGFAAAPVISLAPAGSKRHLKHTLPYVTCAFPFLARSA